MEQNTETWLVIGGILIGGGLGYMLGLIRGVYLTYKKLNG